MALDPVEVDRVVIAQLQQLLPQIGVEGGLLVRLDPPLGLPAPGPARLQGVDQARLKPAPLPLTPGVSGVSA